jgi:hypothetical protein
MRAFETKDWILPIFKNSYKMTFSITILEENKYEVQFNVYPTLCLTFLYFSCT